MTRFGGTKVETKNITPSQERRRAELLRNEPYREGHYRLRRGNRYVLVKVSALLYPSIVWFIEELEYRDGDYWSFSRKKLRPNVWAKLEPFI